MRRNHNGLLVAGIFEGTTCGSEVPCDDVAGRAVNPWNWCGRIRATGRCVGHLYEYIKL
jgi:hypothetical protein